MFEKETHIGTFVNFNDEKQIGVTLFYKIRVLHLLDAKKEKDHFVNKIAEKKKRNDISNIHLR